MRQILVHPAEVAGVLLKQPFSGLPPSVNSLCFATFPSALAFLFPIETQGKEKPAAFGPLFLTTKPENDNE